MEDVLDLYARPADETVARICFDERPCQLLGDVMVPLPMTPGHPHKEDYEYKRQGTAVILLAYDIDRGHRYLQVRARRTKADYTDFMAWLVRTHYPTTPNIQVVQDNLNTHTYGSFYEHLPYARAHELRNQLEFHFTPKHASWLNMAELEFAALGKQCLDHRIATQALLEQEALAWQDERNQQTHRIVWSFTTTHARQKLKRLYKAVNPNN